MKKVFSILLALAMAVLCLFGAFANEDTGRAYELPSSQGVIPPTEEEILAGEQKAADMHRLVELLGLGYGNCSEIQSASRVGGSALSNEEMSELQAILEEYGTNEYTSVLPLSTNSVTRQIKRLDIPALSQKNGYYCGPASAQMILRGEDVYVTQDDLADDLETNSEGTSFGSNWESALNEYSDNDYQILWGSPSDPTDRAILMTDSAIGTLARGYGVIYDTIQYAGTSTNRLVGYSNYLPNNIYHYVAGTGYNNNQPEDRICYYNDPNAGRPDAYGEQEIGFRLMCTLMKDRGLVF